MLKNKRGISSRVQPSPYVAEKACEPKDLPFSRMHQIESLIDFVQRERMRHEFVHFQLARQILFDQLRNAIAALPTCKDSL